MADDAPLLERISERSRRALRLGKLRSIKSRELIIEDGGVAFVVRIAENLARKQADQTPPGESVPAATINPFLPFDAELFVAEVSPTHLLLLNKYNVIGGHVLIVTRTFEDQERLLTLDDFTALWRCLAEIDGLGFYNGGTLAGASQPHKHLQLVPLPLSAAGPAVPMFARIPSEAAGDGFASIAGMGFRHAFARLDRSLSDDPPRAAAAAWDGYRGLLAAIGIDALADGRQSAAYNLLVSRDIMLAVRRQTECFAGISINALGFAGSLFVRNAGELATVRRVRPMTILRAVAAAAD
jgi:ATP adenylyltransferase